MKKITVAWANNQHNTIMVTYNTNNWEWSDLAASFIEQRALIDSSDLAQVNIIIDVSNSSIIPKGGSLISASRELKDAHPRQGHTIIVGAHGFIAKIIEIVGKLLGNQRNKLHTATTIKEAFALIADLPAQSEPTQA